MLSCIVWQVDLLFKAVHDKCWAAQGPGASREAEAAARAQAAGRSGRSAAGHPVWAGLQGAQAEPAMS